MPFKDGSNWGIIPLSANKKKNVIEVPKTPKARLFPAKLLNSALFVISVLYLIRLAEIFMPKMKNNIWLTML